MPAGISVGVQVDAYPCMKKQIRIVITGATGMVGMGVLQVCLSHPGIEKILVINRKHCGIQHPKLTEVIHTDFLDLSPVQDKLQGYDACFFCLGVSSVGIDKEAYYKTTYTLTMHFANALRKENTHTTFCYISGAGTNDTSWQNWARVKAKTEKDLMTVFSGTAYGLRPGFIKPVKGQLYEQPFYKYIGWLFPIGRRLFPNGFCTMQELALCMIHLAENGSSKKILEGKDIIAIAAKD